jgi:serine protease AprX
MKHNIIRIALMLCAIALLYAVTLGAAQPVLADAGGIKTEKIEPALLAAMKANPRGQFKVIVHSGMPNMKGTSVPNGLPSFTPLINSKNAQDVKKALTQLNSQRAQWISDRIVSSGGISTNRLSIVGAVATKLSVDGITRLSRDPFVTRIQWDRPIPALGTPGELSLYAQIVRATNVWLQGDKGQGIGVAILDSGVSSHDDVNLPASRIVASVDFTGGTAPGDPGGHGTHVAGIVAGNGTDSAQAREGVAPGANIIDVRVIDSNGNATLSSVVGGIQWVINNRKTYNIRVMNLSLGAPSTVSYRDDVLASAVEMAWNSGIIVVAAAGNSGPTPGTIVTPGSDPFIITVGALDDNGTVATSDDTVAFFSSLGPTVDGLNKPDVVAPGRKIVSLRSVGSYLDNLLPERITENVYFRLSGTSMSAPVVAGTAALMLQKNPWLKPVQVKGLLMQTARPVGTIVNPNTTGAGMIDAYAAVNTALNINYSRVNRNYTPADSFAMSVYPLLKGMPLDGLWRDPNYKGRNWANITWDNITWDRTTWENITWDNITWDNLSWTNITWDNITWDSGTWDTTGGPSSGESIGWDSAKKID